MLIAQVLIYLSVVVFIIAIGTKIWRYATTPIHLRWELYPVAHEGHKKYGGSYYEELQWWERLPKKNLLSELIAIAEEILLLKAVYTNNRKLWYVSYPFHIGLYLLVGLIGLLVLGAIAQLFGLTISATSFSIIGKAIFFITIPVGYAGLTLALIGCIGLLVKRTSDPDLKVMTSLADYCNLAYILTLLIIALATWLLFDQTFSSTRTLVQSLIKFQRPQEVSNIMILEVILFSGFLLYMPFTRMTHFFAKYFTYHKVRWEDSPNLPGGKWENEICKTLNYKVNWQAPHIQTGKTWAEIATQLPTEESQNENK